jgi:histone acetyltransferase (RNA polymerase elongator complex component)
MMTGLPGDTPEKSLNTADEIINLGAAATRIYPCVVIEGTKLAQLYNNHEYSPQTLDEATHLAARLILKFEAADVKILRVGLHPSEELTSATSLIAGPFHPAFREMAESAIWKHRLEAGLDFSADKHLTIYTAANQTAKAAGYLGKNRKFLEQHFKSVGFKTDSTLQNRAFYADYC